MRVVLFLIFYFEKKNKNPMTSKTTLENIVNSY